MGVVTALVVLALAVLAAIAAVQVHAGHRRTVLGEPAVVARWLRDHTWDDVGIVVVGAVATAVGLLLLLAAVLPARRRLVPVREAAPNVTSGITRRGLRVDLAAVAEGVDGVSSAKARVCRRWVRVRAASELRDRHGIEESIVAAVAGELDRLGLQRQRTVRARVSGPAADPAPVDAPRPGSNPGPAPTVDLVKRSDGADQQSTEDRP